MASLSLTKTADSGDEITILSASCISSINPCNTFSHPLNLHERRDRSQLVYKDPADATSTHFIVSPMNIISVTSPYHSLICSVFRFTNITRPSPILTQKDFHHDLTTNIHISSLFFQSNTLPLHSFSPTKTKSPLFSQTKLRGYDLKFQIDITVELNLQSSSESFIVVGEDNCPHRYVAVGEGIISKSKRGTMFNIVAVLLSFYKTIKEEPATYCMLFPWRIFGTTPMVEESTLVGYYSTFGETGTSNVRNGPPETVPEDDQMVQGEKRQVSTESLHLALKRQRPEEFYVDFSWQEDWE